MIDPKVKAMAIKNAIKNGGGGGFATGDTVTKPQAPQAPQVPQVPVVQKTQEPLDDVESILESLENLSVTELKEVHDKSKEILETYFKELSDMFPKTRRKKS